MLKIYPWVFCLSLVLLPFGVFADDIYQYAKILEVQGSNLLVQYGGMDDHPIFRCSLDNFDCDNLGTTTPSINIPSELKGGNYFYNGDKSLAFLSKKVGNTITDAVYRISNGVASLDRTLDLNIEPMRVFWSSDNSKIVIVGKGSPAELVTYDLTSNKVLQRFNVDIANASRFTISPDANFFAYYVSAMFSKEKDRTFHLVNLSNGAEYETKSKVDYWDLLTEESKLIDFSPDSKKMAYLDDRGGFQTLYTVDLESTFTDMLKGKPLTSKKYTINDFLFWNNDDLFFVANRDHPQKWALFKYNFKTEMAIKVADDVSYAQPIKKIGNYLVALQLKNSSTIPLVYSVADSTPKLFPVMTGAAVNKQIRQEAVTVGGYRGVLLKPANYSSTKKYPLLVWLHGGPYRQAALGFHSYSSYAIYDWVLDKVAANGVVVLKLDYRGSYGYGRKFSETIKNNVGKGDVADVLGAVKDLEKKVKISKTYLIGNSYGGYLALRTIVEKPNLLAGAFSINGVTNWPMLLKHYGNSIFNVYFNGLPNSKNAKLFKQAAIESKIAKLGQQKIIVAQSTSDSTVPPDQGPYIVELLVDNNKNVEYIELPDEDHVPKQKTNVISLCHSVFDFVDLPNKTACDR